MVIDSSVWLEILRDGSLAKKCQKFLDESSQIKVPTLVLFEVYKKLKVKSSEDNALEAVSFLSQFEILDLTREISLLAGDVSLEHDLSMADSIVLAHALYLNESLVTLDNDFASVSSAIVLRK